MSSALLTAVAEAMGAPAAIVQRSAQARAGADGVSMDEVLSAWSGGGTVAPTATAPEPAPEPQPTPEEVAPPPAAPAPPPPPPAALETPAPESSPVLEGRRESWVALLAGSIGLFLVAASFALVLPALDATPAVTPPSGLSALGLAGREIYVAEGCWYCHTQQVRPIVTDARLGPVTQPDLLASFSPDTLGIQRIGPDLAHAGSREPTNDSGWLTEFLTDPRSVRENGLQPEYGHLSDTDLKALVQYLLESR